jgi:hypothetical protein
MKSNFSGGAGKSRLKLKVAHLPTKPPPTLRLGGFQPPDEMPAGEYKVVCEGASKRAWKRGWRIDFKYRVIDGEYTGVALNQWISVDASGVINPRSRYAQQCETALRRPLESHDDLNDPASIFSRRVFRAFVGFRKTEKPDGGMASDENAMSNKGRGDGLRVHGLLACEEL